MIKAYYLQKYRQMFSKINARLCIINFYDEILHNFKFWYFFSANIKIRSERSPNSVQIIFWVKAPLKVEMIKKLNNIHNIVVWMLWMLFNNLVSRYILYVKTNENKQFSGQEFRNGKWWPCAPDTDTSWSQVTPACVFTF